MFIKLYEFPTNSFSLQLRQARQVMHLKVKLECASRRESKINLNTDKSHKHPHKSSDSKLLTRLYFSSFLVWNIKSIFMETCWWSLEGESGGVCVGGVWRGGWRKGVGGLRGQRRDWEHIHRVDDVYIKSLLFTSCLRCLSLLWRSFCLFLRPFVRVWVRVLNVLRTLWCLIPFVFPFVLTDLSFYVTLCAIFVFSSSFFFFFPDFIAVLFLLLFFFLGEHTKCLLYICFSIWLEEVFSDFYWRLMFFFF